MAYEKPLIVKILGWVLYLVGTLIHDTLEDETKKSTDSLSLINERYERNEMGFCEYQDRRAKIMGD